MGSNSYSSECSSISISSTSFSSRRDDHPLSSSSGGSGKLLNSSSSTCDPLRPLSPLSQGTKTFIKLGGFWQLDGVSPRYTVNVCVPMCVSLSVGMVPVVVCCRRSAGPLRLHTHLSVREPPACTQWLAVHLRGDLTDSPKHTYRHLLVHVNLHQRRGGALSR